MLSFSKNIVKQSYFV